LYYFLDVYGGFTAKLKDGEVTFENELVYHVLCEIYYILRGDLIDTSPCFKNFETALYKLDVD